MPPLRPLPYTDPAHQMLGLAGKIATRLRAGYTGTEHLLLALLLFPDCGAGTILQRCDIDAEAIRRRLRNLMVVHEPGDWQAGTTRPTDALNTVLADAATEAGDLDLPCIASEQLLVALLKQQDTVAARVLGQLGLDLERCRDQVRRLHAMPGSREALNS